MLEKVHSGLVNGQPQHLGPVGGEALRDIENGGPVQGPGLDEVKKGLLGLHGVHVEERLVVHGHGLVGHHGQEPRGEGVADHLPVVGAHARVVAELDLGPQSAEHDGLHLSDGELVGPKGVEHLEINELFLDWLVQLKPWLEQQVFLQKRMQAEC